MSAHLTLIWPDGRREVYLVPRAEPEPLLVDPDAGPGWYSEPGWALDRVMRSLLIRGERVLESGGHAVRPSGETVTVVVPVGAFASLTVAPA